MSTKLEQTPILLSCHTLHRRRFSVAGGVSRNRRYLSVRVGAVVSRDQCQMIHYIMIRKEE